MAARSSRSWSMRSFMANWLSLNSGDAASTSDRRTEICSAWNEWAWDATPRRPAAFNLDRFQALFMVIRSISGLAKDILCLRE
jgi:hypothetical protein